MRTIKFRGKSCVTKQWVYGFYCQNELTKKHYIINSDNEQIQVDEHTVGMFIGIVGKNKQKIQEIYEDDIIEYMHDLGKTWLVFYDEREVAFALKVFRISMYAKYSHTSCESIYLRDSFFDKQKIIGNIHDNPKLLSIETMPKKRMRTIKFRGKSCATKQWVYGFYYKNELTKKHYIISSDNERIQVDEHTVGMFIALINNKTQEMYEGDIVKHKYIWQGKENLEAVYDEQEKAFAFKYTTKYSREISNRFNWFTLQPFDLIDPNIFNGLEEISDIHNELALKVAPV